MTEPSASYAAYMHNVSDPSGNDGDLLIPTVSKDFKLAYDRMKDHAAVEIGNHPEWGATREVQGPGNLFQVVDSFDRVLLHYEIGRVQNVGDDDDPVWLGHNELEPENKTGHIPNMAKHYALYVDRELDPKPDVGPEGFIQGFTSFEEARSGMIQAASSQFKKKNVVGSNFQEWEIILSNKNNEPTLRFLIKEGRLVDSDNKPGHKIFVTEEDWQNNASRKTVPSSHKSDHGTTLSTLPLSSNVSRLRNTRPQEQQKRPNELIWLETGTVRNDDLDEDHPLKLWCTCRRICEGAMTFCSDENCVYGWFHNQCVGLERVVDENEDWYCPDCSKSRVRRSTRRRKR